MMEGKGWSTDELFAPTVQCEIYRWGIKRTVYSFNNDDREEQRGSKAFQQLASEFITVSWMLVLKLVIGAWKWNVALVSAALIPQDALW